MRIAALDYGKVRIGIALTDDRGTMALPFATVLTEKTLQKTAEKIEKELSAYLSTIQTIIIGLPLLLSGEEGEMALLVKDFARVLEDKLHIQVIFWDERLSSESAHTILKEIGMNRKKRSKIVDPVAATLLLQSYLEASKNKS